MIQHVLVADDDAAIVDVVSQVLADEGYEVSTAQDGNVFARIKQRKPDLILLDIWMSGIDGRDIVKHLKSQADTRDIPVIIFSANRDCERIARKAGADDWLVKPFDIEDLLEKVGQLMPSQT